MAKQNKNVVAPIVAEVNNGKFEFPTAASMAKAVVQTIVVVAKKSHLAQIIFDESYKMNPVPQRKDIIARLMAEASLTAAGAATYLQNMKKKAGYVQAKA